MVQEDAVSEHKSQDLLVFLWTCRAPASQAHWLLSVKLCLGVGLRDQPFCFVVDFQLACRLVTWCSEVTGDYCIGSAIDIHHMRTLVVGPGGDVLAIRGHITEELVFQAVLLHQSHQVTL